MKKSHNNPHEGHWFGNQPVDPVEKADLVESVFSSVAKNYDLMNDAMSLGIHRLWKDHFVEQLPLRKDIKILDVASGTGDIVARMLKKLPNVQVTASDVNPAMLERGKANLRNQGLITNIQYQLANAEALPFASNQFDLYTIAFGLRNVTHIDQALMEAHRVLRPGGQFFCLEFSHVEMQVLKQLYDFHSFKILPLLGQILAKDRKAYQYLAESIRKFPLPDQLAQRMQKAGFEEVHYRRLSFGIVAIHSGWKV